ncbi:hypothetical protein DFH29DRAFT_881208 [Suillus ampliporus]|nr:hypothetical protein DFH29DRAFT_881208 [Suillus ampliporus]
MPCLAVLTVLLLKSIDPSFCLLNTWVPPGIQDTLNEACKAELSAQAGLMMMMHHAKAEVEVYELAIENVPASNFLDRDVDALVAASPSSCPNLSPLLPEDICRYKEYINAESLDNSSSEDLCCNCFRKDVDGIKFVDSGGCLYGSEIVSLASDWLGNMVGIPRWVRLLWLTWFVMLETIIPHLAVNGIHNCTWAAQKIFKCVQIPEEIQYWGLTRRAQKPAEVAEIESKGAHPNLTMEA